MDDDRVVMLSFILVEAFMFFFFSLCWLVCLLVNSMVVFYIGVVKEGVFFLYIRVNKIVVKNSICNSKDFKNILFFIVGLIVNCLFFFGFRCRLIF